MADPTSIFRPRNMAKQSHAHEQENTKNPAFKAHSSLVMDFNSVESARVPATNNAKTAGVRSNQVVRLEQRLTQNA